MALPFASIYFIYYVVAKLAYFVFQSVVACYHALELEAFDQNKIYIINMDNNSFETTVRLQPWHMALVHYMAKDLLGL